MTTTSFNDWRFIFVLFYFVLFYYFIFIVLLILLLLYMYLTVFNCFGVSVFAYLYFLLNVFTFDFYYYYYPNNMTLSLYHTWIQHTQGHVTIYNKNSCMTLSKQNVEELFCINNYHIDSREISLQFQIKFENM